MTHQPKLQKCFVCKKYNDDCSKLDFKRMPTISRQKRVSGVVIVKCTEFVKITD